MSVETRGILFSIDLPVIACDSPECKRKYVLMEVCDTQEIDMDNFTYYQEKSNFCPFCGKKND